MTVAKTLKMDMTREAKATKSMVRFKEANEDRPITLYLRKSQVEDLGGEVGDIEVVIRKKA